MGTLTYHWRYGNLGQSLASRLTLKHLRLIAAVAEHRQLSLAAHALTLTQPAASRLLAEIEVLVGAPLFERHPRGNGADTDGRRSGPARPHHHRSAG